MYFEWFFIHRKQGHHHFFTDQRNSRRMEQGKFDLGALIYLIKMNDLPGNTSNPIFSSDGICGV